MDRCEWMTRLHRALYRRDAGAVVGLARDPTRPADVLQLLGDGLAVALGARLDSVRPVVVECVAALRARGWEGDIELADQLDTLRGVGPTPLPQALAVDLEQLSEILEGDR